jgi:hypothetical protein
MKGQRSYPSVVGEVQKLPCYWFSHSTIYSTISILLHLTLNSAQIYYKTLNKKMKGVS